MNRVILFNVLMTISCMGMDVDYYTGMRTKLSISELIDQADNSLEDTPIVSEIIYESLKNSPFPVSKYTFNTDINPRYSLSNNGDQVIHFIDNHLVLEKNNGEWFFLCNKEKTPLIGSFFAHGTKVALSFGDTQIHIFSTSTGELEQIHTFEDPVTAVTYSFDDNKLATAHANGKIVIWDKWLRPLYVFSSYVWITSIALSQKTLRIAAGSPEQTLFYLDELAELEHYFNKLFPEQKICLRILYENHINDKHILPNSVLNVLQTFPDNLRYAIEKLYLSQLDE